MKKPEVVVASAAITLVMYTLVLSIAGQVLSSVQASRTVSSTGTIKAIGVGVYWNKACTNSCTSIPWGTIEPGTTTNKLVYIRNEGDYQATLSMSTGSWNPPTASQYLRTTWNYTNAILVQNQVIPVRMSLQCFSNVTGITSFNYNITIIASG